MIMDYLRTCYRSKMRLFRDRPDIETIGRWMFCPPGAKPLPFAHPFASQVWDPDREKLDPLVGEVPGYLGNTDGFASERYLGQNYCGTVYDWQNGSLFAQQGTPKVDDDDIPRCCKKAPKGAGGIDLGGDAVFVGYEAVDVGFDIAPGVPPFTVSGAV